MNIKNQKGFSSQKFFAQKIVVGQKLNISRRNAFFI
tara:strand:- start:57942 stop:58049 length:108 start_codon:yes stop_codon:yes gene_type:complete